jgi:hypothetical protein
LITNAVLVAASTGAKSIGAAFAADRHYALADAYAVRRRGVMVLDIARYGQQAE